MKPILKNDTRHTKNNFKYSRVLAFHQMRGKVLGAGHGEAGRVEVGRDELKQGVECGAGRDM